MALKRQFSVAPFLLSLTLLIFLEGVDVTSSTKDIFEKCCELGDSWAENKLRCEKFTGPVPGVEETELEACYETVDICCRKAYQRKSCDRGKADAKAGLSCVKNETGSNRSQNEQLADYQRDCCEGCKLGILTGSSGKGCAFKKISLGIPWDPAFEECCAEVITDTSKGTLSTVSTNGTTPTTSSSIVTSSESDELDDIFKEDTDFNPATSFNSDDLCQLMKGLLCSEICVPTPGSYYCKCQENSILQEDGRTCKSNLTSTQTPIVSLTTSTSTPNINSISDTSKFLSTDVDLSTSSDSSSSTKSTSELLNSTLSLISSSQKTTSKISLKSTSTIAQSTSAIVQNSTKHMSPIGTLKLLTLAKSRTTRSLSTENNELNLPCPLGYRYNPSSEVCDDVDECNGIENEKHAASCPPGSGCHDTKGRYRCTRSAQDRGLENRSCEPGYRWNSTLGQCLDIDECSENTHKCSSVTENCKNLEGSYICEIKCERGFIFNDDYGECLDINECIEMTNVCRQPDTICINTLGSFMCKSLREYQRLNEPSLGENGSNDRQMNYYESADDEDIDECQLHPQPCAPGELCRNIIGGYDCIPAGCPRGFALANDTCADVNECEQGLHSCAPHERCQNTNGSFTCETPRTTRRPSLTEAPLVICRKGYRADVASGRCLDIDECVEGPGCRDHERCHNLQGSYDCSPLCGPGWYFQIQTKTCQDVDECLLGHHNCRQRTQYCRNTNGSYVCEALSACPAGYRRAQNGSCIDVDECLESLHTCSRDLHRYCVNRDGGYECITRLPSCSRGFEYSLFTRQCEDVDECRRGTANCDANMNERCVNLPGGYRCERPQLELRIRWRRPACPVGHTYDVALRKCVGKEADDDPRRVSK